MITAWLLAPVVSVLTTWAATYAVVALADKTSLPSGAAGHTLFFFLFFGVPLAYGTAALGAWPIYAALRRRSRLGPISVVTCAAVLGGIAVPVAMAAFFGLGPTSDLLPEIAVGLVAGSTGGATFWAVGLAGLARRVA